MGTHTSGIWRPAKSSAWRTLTTLSMFDPLGTAPVGITGSSFFMTRGVSSSGALQPFKQSNTSSCHSGERLVVEPELSFVTTVQPIHPWRDLR
jgi:hypothetical protein